MKKALIVWGGWDGHEPEQVAGIFANILRNHQFDVEVADTLEAYADAEKLMGLDLIVPVWTMGKSRKHMSTTYRQPFRTVLGSPGATAACATPSAIM